MLPTPFEVKVILISEQVLPVFLHLHMQEHVEDTRQAEAWGRDHLHAVVYYLEETQTAYAERCACRDIAGDNAACRVHHPAGRAA